VTELSHFSQNSWQVLKLNPDKTRVRAQLGALTPSLAHRTVPGLCYHMGSFACCQCCAPCFSPPEQKQHLPSSTHTFRAWEPL